MNWFVFWIVIYLLVIAWFAFRHVKAMDIDNYLVNNRNTGTLPLVFTTLATFVGGGTSIGLMAMGYESGFAAIGIGIAYVIGFFIIARYAGRIRRIGITRNIYSFPEFLNKNYTDAGEVTFTRWFSATVSGVNIFIFFFLLSAQFVGMASLLRFAFDIGYIQAAIISCLVVIAYTAIAGLSGVIITDTIQFIVIVLMIIFIFIPGILQDTGNFSRLQELPEHFIDGTYYGYLFLLGLPLFLAPSVMVRMDIWQRLLAARNEKVAKRVSLISGLGMLPFYIIFPLVGMALKIVHTEVIEPKYVAYHFLERHSTSFILGFAVVGLLSALMSSGDSFLNLVSISAIRDFLGWKKKQEKSTRMHSRIRIAAFIFGFIALFMALVFPRIVDLMVVGLATIVIFVPVTFLALLKKDAFAYRKIALGSILSGFAANLVFFLLGIFVPETFEPKSSFIPAFLLSLLVLLGGIIFRVKNDKINSNDHH
jgi:SSS family solute:Na+ symporter